MTSGFQLIILGSGGGPFEDNCAGFLLAPLHSDHFVALDAGTMLSGIKVAAEKGNLPKNIDFGEFFIKNIKGYLITHPHLDHLVGLVINSQADNPKHLLGTASTLSAIKNHLFNGIIWPLERQAGSNKIGKYYPIIMEIGHSYLIPDTNMMVEPFLLSHPGIHLSTAFLIKNEAQEGFLYFGDTAADVHEKEKRIERIWKKISVLVSKNQLKGIIIECSYPNDLEETKKHGHLDPHTLEQSLNKLAELSKNSLEGLPVLVVHRKDAIEGKNDPKKLIETQLKSTRLPVEWIFPENGSKFTFP